MPRRRRSPGLIALAGLFALAPRAGGAEAGLSAPATQAKRFVEALNERGYSDWALDYVEQQRQAADTPAEVKAVLELEEGVAMAAQATRTADLAQRAGLYEEAVRKLDAFQKAHEGTALGIVALRQQARVLVEAGHLAELRSQDAKLPDEVKVRQGEARALLGRAREGFSRVEGPLKAAYDGMPKSLSDDDPMRQARDRALVDWVDARLQLALVDYEEAQTFPPASREKEVALDRARKRFETIADEHRLQMAGVVARMWQGKCFEERNGPGDLGRAMGIYDELKDEPDPRLRPLLRQVAYFRIILMGKRGDFALAQAEAERWLKEEAHDRQNDEALGVLVELGRDLLGQAQAKGEDAPKEADRGATIRRAGDVLGEVTKVSSRHKRAAILLLRQARAGGATPKGADDKKPAAASLKPDEALAAAEAAVGEEKYDEAIALLRSALRKLDPAKDLDKINTGRALLAFALYSDKQYAEADVVAEHLARSYPKDEQANRSIEIALASLGAAFNESPAAERAAEADRLASLAAFTAQAMPDSESADVARVTLGEIEMSRRRFDDAAKALEAMRDGLTATARCPGQGRQGPLAAQPGIEGQAPRGQGRGGSLRRAVPGVPQGPPGRQGPASPTPRSSAPPATWPRSSCSASSRPRPSSLLDPLVKAADRKPSEEEAPLRARLVSTQLRALDRHSRMSSKAVEPDGRPSRPTAGRGRGWPSSSSASAACWRSRSRNSRPRDDPAAHSRRPRRSYGSVPRRHGRRRRGPDLRVAGVGRRVDALPGRRRQGRPGLRAGPEDLRRRRRVPQGPRRPAPPQPRPAQVDPGPDRGEGLR